MGRGTKMSPCGGSTLFSHPAESLVANGLGVLCLSFVEASENQPESVEPGTEARSNSQGGRGQGQAGWAGDETGQGGELHGGFLQRAPEAGPRAYLTPAAPNGGQLFSQSRCQTSPARPAYGGPPPRIKCL